MAFFTVNIYTAIKVPSCSTLDLHASKGSPSMQQQKDV